MNARIQGPQHSRASELTRHRQLRRGLIKLGYMAAALALPFADRRP
jgi:hypothetical protein